MLLGYPLETYEIRMKRKLDNLIMQVFGAPFGRPFAPPFGPRLAVVSGDWWEGATFANQPKGAASAAASYVNLANPGTYDLSNGTAYPAFNTATGWTFDGDSSQYLLIGAGTGPVLSGAVSYLVRVNMNRSASNIPILGTVDSLANFNTRILATTQLHTIRMQTTAIGTGATAISTEKVIGATYTAAGAFIMYLNGASDGTGTNNQTITGDTDAIGRFSTTYAFGVISALGVWESVLTPAEVARRSTAMLAI